MSYTGQVIITDYFYYYFHWVLKLIITDNIHLLLLSDNITGYSVSIKLLLLLFTDTKQYYFYCVTDYLYYYYHVIRILLS